MAEREPVEGKTKIVFPVIAAELVAKDDITAGDGAKRDVLPGKGVLATQTTVNIFELLRFCDVPVAYIGRGAPNSFYAHHCRMLPFEVVVRGEAFGSILKRNPTLTKGQAFTPPVVEFFLKTSGKMWKGAELGCDDPLVHFGEDALHLFRPDLPYDNAKSFIWSLAYEGVFEKTEGSPSGLVQEMAQMAAQAFRVLTTAFGFLGYRYVDFKVEFGITADGRLVIADVIDNDSGRLLVDDEHFDKQTYREGAPLAQVLKKYQKVVQITEEFRDMRGSVRSACAEPEQAPFALLGVT